MHTEASAQTTFINIVAKGEIAHNVINSFTSKTAAGLLYVENGISILKRKIPILVYEGARLKTTSSWRLGVS